MTWIAILDGNPTDLSELVHSLNGEDLDLSIEDGNFMLRSARFEVHDDPTSALCDGAQALRLEQLAALMTKIQGLRAALHPNPQPSPHADVTATATE